MMVCQILRQTCIQLAGIYTTSPSTTSLGCNCVFFVRSLYGSYSMELWLLHHLCLASPPLRATWAVHSMCLSCKDYDATYLTALLQMTLGLTERCAAQTSKCLRSYLPLGQVHLPNVLGCYASLDGVSYPQSLPYGIYKSTALVQSENVGNGKRAFVAICALP